MFNYSTPLPTHRTCPSSGAIIFDPDPSVAIAEKIKKMSSAMLSLSGYLSRGEAPPEELLAVLQELER